MQVLCVTSSCGMHTQFLPPLLCMRVPLVSFRFPQNGLPRGWGIDCGRDGDAQV